MTEAEWPEWTAPEELFRLIEGKSSERKCVLFALACHHLPPAYDPAWPESVRKRAVEFTAAVDYVDGRIGVAAVRRLWQRSGEARSLPERGPEWAKSWACPPFRDYEDPFEIDVAALVRDVFGNPFRPASAEPDWRTSTVIALAEAIYTNCAFDRMPILADALQDAGCDNADILAHCRGGGRHVRGCWVVDLLLGKT